MLNRIFKKTEPEIVYVDRVVNQPDFMLCLLCYAIGLVVGIMIYRIATHT